MLASKRAFRAPETALQYVRPMARKATAQGVKTSLSGRRQHARTHETGRVERMNQSNGTSFWVWVTLGLIGIALNAFAPHDISARIKARPEALELHGTISD